MRHALCAALLATLPLGALAAPADVQANRQGSDSCRSGVDASCLSAGSRQATSQQQLEQQAPMAAAGCKQGSADSSCAIPVGGAYGSYSAGAPVSTLTPCYNYGPSTWDGACPAGQLGAITYRQTYSCPTQNVVGANGVATPMAIEPGQWSPAAQIASTCYTPPPPTPPAPVYTRIYMLSIDTYQTTSSDRVTITIYKNKMDGSPTTYVDYRTGVWYNIDMTLPWGFDYRPYYWPLEGYADAAFMRAPMQFFVDKGCKLVSDDPDLRYGPMAGWGKYFGGLSVWQTFWFGSGGTGYTNWAICPTDVGIGG